MTSRQVVEIAGSKINNLQIFEKLSRQNNEIFSASLGGFYSVMRKCLISIQKTLFNAYAPNYGEDGLILKGQYDKLLAWTDLLKYLKKQT